MYIRILPSSKSFSPSPDPFSPAFQIDQADDRHPITQSSDKQWWGIRIGHTPNFVFLRDTDHRLTAWWWAGIRFSGTRLVSNPALVRLDHEERVLNGLALVTDIVAISPMLQRYDPFFASLLQNDRKVRGSLSGLESIVCNLMMEELGLQCWGRISLSLRHAKYVLQREDRRKVILFVLAVYSNLFFPPLEQTAGDGGREWQRMSAQQILDSVIEGGNLSQGDFSKLCRQLIEDWLCSWGCPRDKLEQFNAENELPVPFGKRDMRQFSARQTRSVARPQ